MPLIQLDTENADRDLTSAVTVLTHTPTSGVSCQGYICLGDGSKNLSGTGGAYEFTVIVGGQVIQPSPQIVVFSTDTRAAVWTHSFSVPANMQVTLTVLSPNAAETDVDVTAYLFELAGAEDIYHADTFYTKDTNDEYTVQWYKNGIPLTSGITSPTIQLIKRSDGTDLVAATVMTQVGTTGAYKYDEATNKQTIGEAYIAVASATIDSATRTWRNVLGRDL